ncbi:hypothetical protein DRO64_04155 [Candidatus Bathyarchaeota archaeon]|nr:MAG: hypothetical protein DRO64_04155 [Candidatus Bathyarchaeota archaeon]
MIKHIVYVTLAVMLGIGMMALPMMIMQDHHPVKPTGEMLKISEPMKNLQEKKEKSMPKPELKNASESSADRRAETITSRLIHSIPKAATIAIIGLASATIIFLITKRKIT